ncbi:MAG TPA: hypothetical protein P5064_00575 [Clostridia bacterium]|jgi:hypothetical protein|nr:hypothetical protein [Clostridiaceae bacterium]HOF26208.1 hypothetical protein [Clostridia bacterium]HOR90612.1 hypothetical protein [Clostridia bacterium]HOT71592.1 hypothetical protein [Clostridia bacterium]HPL07658.1 hypothetical protein [Clostridia bacterium]
MMKNKLKFLLFILLLVILVGCNNMQPGPTDGISETEVIDDSFEGADAVTKDEGNIKYWMADINILIDILNEYYENELVMDFRYRSFSGTEIKPIESRYDNDTVHGADGSIMSMTGLIQGIVSEKGNSICINIIEDKTFDNGGYIFSNISSFSYDYFNNYGSEKYTVSVYKYKNCYIVFEFFNSDLSPEDKTDIIENCVAVVEENYTEKKKVLFNENDDFYIPKEHTQDYINNLKNALNTLYKDNLTSKFQKYTKSDVPLFEIRKKGESVLAETTYYQGTILKDRKAIVSIAEDNVVENNGFIYTTATTDDTPGIQIYRYNKLYLIFEFYDDPATAFWNNDVVRSVAKVLSDLEK